MFYDYCMRIRLNAVGCVMTIVCVLELMLLDVSMTIVCALQSMLLEVL